MSQISIVQPIIEHEYITQLLEILDQLCTKSLQTDNTTHMSEIRVTKYCDIMSLVSVGSQFHVLLDNRILK